MKDWKIPVSYTMCATIVIEADTLEEAIEIAKDEDGLIALPTDSSYLDDSWTVDYIDDKDYIRECYNHNQQDDD